MNIVTIDYLIEQLNYIKNNSCGISNDTKVYLYNNEYGANKICKEISVEINADDKDEFIVVLSDI